MSTKKGYVRLLVFLSEAPNEENSKYSYRGIEILDNEFFELGFLNKKYSLQENAFENMFNNLELIYDILEQEKHTEKGIYEIWGVYSETWRSSYDYWGGATEWECDWEISDDLNIKKYEGKILKDYLNDLYLSENPHRALDIIDTLGLTNQLKNILVDTSDSEIFNYTKEETEDIKWNFV